MSVSVSMPQLGESVTEGTVTRWLKKEGERVEADEPLLEVSTDKVDTEIPSPAAGVLREIAVGEDETVEVGAQLAVIEEGADASGGGAPADSPAPAESSDSAESSSDSGQQAEQTQAAPPQRSQASPEPGGYGGDTAGSSPPTGQRPMVPRPRPPRLRHPLRPRPGPPPAQQAPPRRVACRAPPR